MAPRTIPQIEQALRRRVEFHAARGREYNPRVPRLLHPIRFEREYYKELRKSFTLLFEAMKTQLFPALPGLIASGRAALEPQRLQTADAFDDDLESILAGVLVVFGRRLSDDEIRRIAKTQGISVSEFNKRQNNKVFRRLLNIDLFRDEPFLDEALENFAGENVNLITTLSQRHITDVRGIVTRAVRQGLPVAEVERQLRARIGKTDANLRLIARDQVSKLNGQLTRIRQEAVGIESYIWRTSLDERVRASHRVKEGKEYRWDEPPADTGHPGEDFQCRCYAEPVLRDLIDDSDQV